MDDGTSSVWNFLHVTGYIYGICIGAGMLIGMFLARLYSVC